jgi:hypothetical protein
MITLWRMRWAGHAACMREMRYSHKVLVVKPEGKTPIEDLGVERSIILKLILEK